MKLTHDLIERNQALLIVLVIAVVAVGGLVEIRPALLPKVPHRACRRPEAL
jgi:cbb3-type cytochrome oxidase cytochrome c subunit